MSEVWKSVVGYEGFYEVSNLGNVKSVDRVIVSKNNRTVHYSGKALSLNRSSAGYFTVPLNTPSKMKRKLVHRLVLEAFAGPCPKGYECCHYDGDKSNNHLENLRWGSRRANLLDRVRHGSDSRGVKNPMSKLEECDVLKIRKLILDGMGGRKIAKLFGVSQVLVSKIGRREIWGWLED